MQSNTLEMKPGLTVQVDELPANNPSSESDQVAMEDRIPESIQTFNSIAGAMVLVRGGLFAMGSNEGEGDERPVHQVKVSDFYLGQYEVTQSQWRSIMGYLPVGTSSCETCPVTNVSWDEVQQFIQILNRQTSQQYRLPTEAEWEYAAKGGKKNTGLRFAGNDNADEVAWYSSNAGGKLQEVGKKQANALGIHDLSGNVREWCADRYQMDYYEKSPAENPAGPLSGLNRVCRGGGFNSLIGLCRVSDRSFLGQGSRDQGVGFRLALKWN